MKGCTTAGVFFRELFFLSLIHILLFRNPIPAVPMLILYMLYSNMLRIGENGSYIGRPLAIMVRFPGNFFDTTPPPMVLLNQTFLLIASVFLFCITVYLWKRRRI